MNLAVLSGLKTDALPADERLTVDVAARQHHAWQSAMEQAQMADWFKSARDAGHGQRRESEVTAQEPRQASFAAQSESAQASSPRSAHAIAVSQALAAGDPPDEGQQGLSAEVAAPGGGSFKAAGPAGARAAGLAQSLAMELQRYLDGQRPDGAPAAGGAATLPAPSFAPGSLNAAPSAPALSNAISQDLTPGLGAVPPEPVPVPVPPRSIGTAGEPAESLADERALSETIPASPVQSVADDAVPSAVRVHVDWSAEGARVWLGVDQERLPVVPGLARHLEQWLQTGGVKLATLVCNGRTIYARFSQRRS